MAGRVGDGLVGVIPANRDRTGWAELHTLARPSVVDWLRTDAERALERLARARSSFRFAAGIDEVFPLATEGRIELIVAEDGCAPSARLGPQGRLDTADDPEPPEVVDDVDDDTSRWCCATAASRSSSPADLLGDQGRVAAVLRY